MMFKNIFKKIIPLAATAGVAYVAGGGGGNLFATSSIKEKLLELGKKEAIKEGMDAVFGEDDNFVSPYETASVDYDEYKMGMGGTTAQGGVIDFPGAIKSADPATISDLWKQRMNSYVGKA